LSHPRNNSIENTSRLPLISFSLVGRRKCDV